MVGVLNNEETRTAAILQGRHVHLYLGLVDPRAENNTVSIEISIKYKPDISADIQDGIAFFRVDVLLEAEILAIPSGINYETGEYRTLLESQISRLFEGQITSMLKHTQELASDPVGFGKRLRPKFPNYTVMKEADYGELYRTANIKVNVTAKIRRPGMSRKTATPIGSYTNDSWLTCHRRHIIRHLSYKSRFVA